MGYLVMIALSAALFAYLLLSSLLARKQGAPTSTGTRGVNEEGRRGSVGALKGLLERFLAPVMRLSIIQTLRRQKRDERASSECTRAMPELLDVLALGLMAGLSFDTALGLYCARSDSALSGELSETMLKWQMGLTSRSRALEEMAARIGAAPLIRFCHSVSEALSFGAPLAATLEYQSDTMRAEQRSLTEQRIEEVPVRMLLPLGTLVVPAMLLAILGPLLAGSIS